jgi:hypothetical protein
MDISKLRQSQLIVGGAGVLLVISLFLDWVGVSAFSAFSAMDIIMLLVGLGAIAYAAIPASGSELALPRDSSWIVLLLAMAVVGWALGIALEDADAGIGAWLGLIASGAIAFGAYVEVRGGSLARSMAPAVAAPPSPTASAPRPGTAPAPRSGTAPAPRSETAPGPPSPTPTEPKPPDPHAGEGETSGAAEA